MVYEGSRVKTFGPPFFFTGIPLRGLISKIPSTYVFLNVHPWQKPFQTPSAKKLFYSFFDFGLCCPPPVWFMKAQEWKLGPLFFYRYTLARSNIKNSIHIRVFWMCTPGRNHFRPQGQKNYFILSLILVFVVHHQYGLWRLKSENFWVTFFSTGIPLARSNIKNSIHIRVFWMCTPGRNHFRPQAQKNYVFSFFDFGLCCPPPAWFMKAEEWKLLGHLFFTGIPLRGLISKIPSTYVFLNVQGQKTILFFL